MKKITIDKDLKIRSVKKIWEKIDNAALPVEINFKNFEKFDCAGFQLFLFISKLAEEKPESYILSGINDTVLDSLPLYGYLYKRGEHNK